jgi:hypothetical protein
MAMNMKRAWALPAAAWADRRETCVEKWTNEAK